MSKEEVFKKIEAATAKMDEVDDQRASQVLSILERNAGAWFVTIVDLKQTQREAGFYGEVFYRAFKAPEADEILSNRLYQQSSRDWTSLSKEDHDQLFEWKCKIISDVLHPKMKITKDALIKSGNFAFVAYLFNFLTEFSGLGGNIVKDSLWFLQLPERSSVSQTLGAVLPQATERSRIPKLDGQVIGDDYGSNAP